MMDAAADEARRSAGERDHLPASDPQGSTAWWERVGVGATAGATIAVLAWVVFLSRRGFDLTDESFYLLWIRDPGAFPAATTLFGFFYHPLHQVLGGDIFWLRIANSLGMWLVAVLLMHRLAFGMRRNRTVRAVAVGDLVVAAGLATSALAFLVLWLPTPNYNSLALTGLMFVVVGLTYVWQPPERLGLVGWPVMAIGLWLTLLAKPTSAAVMAAVVGAVLLVLGPRSLKGSALGAATGGVLVGGTVLLIGGSVAALRERFAAGSELLEVARSGHGLQESWDGLKYALQLQGVALSWRVLGLIVLLAAFAAATAWLADRLPRAAVAYCVACGVLSLATLVAILGPGSGISLGVLGVAPLLAALGYAFTRMKFSRQGTADEAPAVIQVTAPQAHTVRPVATAVVLCIAPFAHAFGTNNLLWAVIPRAAVFWVAMAVVVVAGLSRWGVLRVVLIPVALVTVLCTAAVLKYATTVPYSTFYGQSAPLPRATEQVALGDNGSLLFDGPTARYLADLQAAAETTGMREGQPLLNLAGLPGAALALGATTPGQPWLNMGYAGSPDVVRLVLAHVDCDVLAETWLLLPGDPDDVASQATAVDGMLRPSGLRFPRDFAPVATIQRPDGLPQGLWQPKGPGPSCAGN